MGLTFSKYVIQPFFPGCGLPETSVRIVATLTICKIVVKKIHYVTIIKCMFLKVF